ncbi:FMN-binding negative transcriptional regulator [Alteromonas sp. ASW11-130]|uniref:FMN-binding negative transcriptional regulator n=1 Tax=Alteromonas sp. ASW11-130 TaxID=3015775 RepID=UPI002242693A|nr:FMN-binding negative transcriptional regulator [Alteromonas sp. ASW11-130]MCW8090946.1 FMN-binding negative transcriptional regulator [Alteromonas sp. ASW11-130]
MHTPEKEKMNDIQAVRRFIEQNGFALLASPTLDATHLPLQIAPEEGKLGTLYGHISRANIQSKFGDGDEVLAVFTGPHSYISPTWYDASPVAVPTWNYAAVHCLGHLKQLHEEETLRQVKQLIAQYEPRLLNDHERMPEHYIQGLLKGIIGFKIIISRIDAREKLGQHRNQADQAGVFRSLRMSNNSDATALANYMSERNVGTGED